MFFSTIAPKVLMQHFAHQDKSSSENIWPSRLWRKEKSCIRLQWDIHLKVLLSASYNSKSFPPTPPLAPAQFNKMWFDISMTTLPGRCFSACFTHFVILCCSCLVLLLSSRGKNFLKNFVFQLCCFAYVH